MKIKTLLSSLAFAVLVASTATADIALTVGLSGGLYPVGGDGVGTITGTTGTVTQTAGNASGVAYQLNNVNLTSVGGTATETINFNLVFSSSTGTVNYSTAYDVLSVGGGGTIDPTETLTVTVGGITSSTFPIAKLSILGLTEVEIDSMGADESMDLAHDGGSSSNIPGTGTKYDVFPFAASNYFTVTGNTGRYYLSGLSIQLNAETVAVPEPSSAAVFGLAGLTLLRRRRR